MLTPFWYQQEAIDASVDFLYNKKGNGVIQAPTASGKSVVQAELIKKIHAIAPQFKILAVTDITALIGQNREELLGQWPEANTTIYSDSYNSKDLTGDVIFAGIQSIYNKTHLLDPVSVVLIDECSTGTYKKGGMYFELMEGLKKTNPHIRVIGLDATPWSMDGVLTDGWLFDEIIYKIEMSTLLDQGFLTPLVTPKVINHADTSQIKTTQKGEYNEKSMREVMEDDFLIDSALDDVMTHAQDRRSWMIFACTVKHAKAIMRKLQERSISCEMVTGDTDDRNPIYERFRNYEFTALVSVNALTTGFNAKNVDLAIVLRATKSSRLWIQMMGRVMRKHPNKVDAMVLDYGENIARFGALEDIQPPPTKAEQKAVKASPFKKCGACGEINPTLAKVCHKCASPFESITAPTHGTTASTENIMRERHPPVWLDVIDVTIRKHTSQQSGNQMIKIAWNCGLHIVEEYVSPSLNRLDFVNWWKDCSIDDMANNPPMDLEIALEEIKAFPQKLKSYNRLLVDMNNLKKKTSGGYIGYKVIQREVVNE